MESPMKLTPLFLAACLVLYSTTATSLQLENRTPNSALEKAQLQLAAKQSELAANVAVAEEAVANAKTNVAKANAQLTLEKALAELLIGADAELGAVESANEARALGTGFIAGI
jgi:signal transduction histidine kinase